MRVLMKTGSKLAIILFCIVATGHLLRVVFAVNLTINNWSAPLWMSVPGFIVPAAIAWMLWRESQ